MGRCGSPLFARAAALLAAAAALVTFTAAPAAAGTPAKAGPPNAIASLGDSITRGFNTCPWSAPYGDCPERSWATGDGSANSQYQRILALNPAISGRTYNNGKTGARIDQMVTQAAAAGANPVKPELVTVLLGANDACTETEGAMTSVTAYRQRLDAGLDQIATSMPDARIYVVSVPNIYELWRLGRGTALESTIWNTANICQSMLANPGSTAPADQQRRERVRQRVADYNAQIRQACDARPHCHHDDGRVFAARFNLDQVSNLDGFHPNEEGQKYLAEVAWQGQFAYGDRTAPGAPTLTPGREPDGEDGWYRGPVAVQAAAAAADAKGSEYALRAGTPSGNPTSWTPWPGTAVNVSAAGRSELQVRTVDAAGNTSASATLVVKVDEVAPTLTLAVPPADGADGWHLTRPAVSVTASDAASGLRDTACTAGGEAAPIVGGKVAVPRDGVVDVRCVARDKAGNETARTLTVKSDVASPAVTLTQAPDGRNGIWRGDATVSFAVDDASPVEVACYRAGTALPVRPQDGSDGRRGAFTVTATGNVTCFATDVAGRQGTAGTTVRIDRSAPNLAIADGDSEGANGLRRTSPFPFVVKTWDATSLACTVGGAPVAVAQPTGPQFETTVLVPGQGDVTLTCTDADDAGNETTISHTVTVDSVAPIVTITQQPDGRDGWWTGPATAKATVADANPGTLACAVGGVPAGDAAEITVTGDGTHDVVCAATDRAGNTASASATVKIDATAPQLALAADPDGANGFFRTAPAPVAVTASGETELACTVDGDDVADPAALTVTGDGTHAVACAARDAAGNATRETLEVRIDTAAPQVTIAQSPDGRDGWWTGAATATAKVTDDHAAALTCTVDGEAVAGDGLERTLAITGDGDHAVRCEGADAAGNTAAGTATVRIDGTAPGLTLTSAPDGDAGWFRSATARVDVESADAAGDVACTVDGAAAPLDAGRVRVTGQGVHDVACAATDQAGNRTARSHAVRIDSVAPAAPAASADRAPEALGWHRDRVTVTWTAVAETGAHASGVDPATVPAAETITRDGESDVTAAVRDRAGNVSESATFRVKVDSAAPTAALACPTGTLAKDAVATADVTAADASSGLVALPATVALDTQAGGEREARLTVRDRVGHETVATCVYRVDAPAAPPGDEPQPPAAPAVPPVPGSASSAAGANGIAGGTSRTITRPSLARLTLTFAPKRPKLGQRLRVTVKLTPAPSTRPRVAIERRVKGKWRRVKTVRLSRQGRATTTLTSLGGDKLRARLLK